GLLQQHAAPRGGMKEAEIHSTGPGLTVQISETTSDERRLAPSFFVRASQCRTLESRTSRPTVIESTER
ncbi:MAG: hypothetical protein OEL76_13305, partial [Siculibacillus sp.]|nr:hypothetical protein [Siculibacillus sp.]